MHYREDLLKIVDAADLKILEAKFEELEGGDPYVMHATNSRMVVTGNFQFFIRGFLFGSGGQP